MVVVIVVIIAVGGYFVLSRQAETPTSQTTPPPQQPVLAKLASWGSGSAKVAFAFAPEQPHVVLDKDVKETKETYTYLDADSGQSRQLNQYRTWSNIVFNREKTATREGKAESTVIVNLFQRVRASIYSPKSELWFHTSTEGSFTNVTFYNFAKNSWFGLTATEEVPGIQIETMRLGFNNPHGARAPKPIFAIEKGGVRANVYGFGSGPTGQGSLLLLYEKPVRMVLVLSEETNCRTLDIASDCLDFYRENLFDKNLLESAILPESL